MGYKLLCIADMGDPTVYNRVYEKDGSKLEFETNLVSNVPLFSYRPLAGCVSCRKFHKAEPTPWLRRLPVFFYQVIHPKAMIGQSWFNLYACFLSLICPLSAQRFFSSDVRRLA
jgi:hypothetical protein